MHKIAFMLPFALAACVSAPAILTRSPLAEEARPAVGNENLRGRWVISAVDGQPTTQLWLELGQEGTVAMTKRADGGINIGSPQPPTSAFLGCNNLQLTGWTRNGDKLSLGLEGSMKTKRGCDAATIALEERAYAILRTVMTMDFDAPGELRLISEKGNLNLKRSAAVR